MLLSSTRKDWLGNVRGDVLAGIVVALALIPEAIAFSIIAGVDPQVGLYSAFCIPTVMAFLGGRPAMISSATGAMALLLITLVKTTACVSAGGLGADRRTAAGGRLPEAGQPDALRLPLGGHRFRERAGHPDIYGAAAGADQRHWHVYAPTAAGLASFISSRI